MLKKIGYIFLSLVLVATWMLNINGSTVRADSSSTNVIIHYYRFNSDYSNWNLWLWPKNGDGSGYDFSGSDSYGKVANVNVPGTPDEVGLIVRKGNWEAKDIDSDRYIDLSKGHEVWLVQGINNVFYSQADAEKASTPSISNAYLDNKNQVLVKLNQPLTLSSGASGFTVTDQTTQKDIPVSSVEDENQLTAVVVGDFQSQLGGGNWDPSNPNTVLHKVNSNLYQFSADLKEGSYQYKIVLNHDWGQAYPTNNVNFTVPAGGSHVTFSYVPSIHQVNDSLNNPNATLPQDATGVSTDLVKVTLGDAPDVTHTLFIKADGYQPGTIIPRKVLDLPAYYYEGEDLGNTWTSSSTSFKVWAPTASQVNLLLYDSATGSLTKKITMKPSEKGTWALSVDQKLENWYYTYEVTNQGSTKEAVDPYAQAIAPNGTRGMIVDMSKTNPAGWSADQHVTPKNIEDEIIYEMHMRDFSINQNSGMQNKGEYLALTEHGTKGPDHVKTGLDHLKELGITHVQLLPVFGFNSVDETNHGQFNWGYDPRNYNVPEGEYATTADGTARIKEFKQMVQSLHDSHIGVNMDVVYNHTFATQISDFDKIVPQYYYRTDDAGNYTNGSGVGNEVAAERPMVQKFILDSLKMWATEYHIDGFRFDLMALLGKDTMTKAADELHAIDPGIALYGEPWTGGTSPLPANQLLTKGQQKGLGIAVFNDNIRNGLDGNVFDASAQGFATGATGLTDVIKKGVEGSINDFTASPGETINYVTSHDNFTLWDKISKSNPNDSGADRIKMDELAQAVVMTSQGISFMQGGEEMLRTKGGNDNSYNAGDQVNEFDWSRKAQYPGVFDYYSGLIHLRRDHPAFRMATANDIKNDLQFLKSPANTVAFELTGHANHDTWGNIVVIYNPNKTAATLTLPSGEWEINATEGKVSHSTLGHAEGTVEVPAISMVVLHQNENGPVAAGHSN
jgi:pullulanase